ncbi:hypothetical protein TYRP_018075 [Tyrophagus putrescentiae]|nr:hypothetical protein TYRP_018075 [Tyrophagus putrescentiae]
MLEQSEEEEPSSSSELLFVLCRRLILMCAVAGCTDPCCIEGVGLGGGWSPLELVSSILSSETEEVSVRAVVSLTGGGGDEQEVTSTVFSTTFRVLREESGEPSSSPPKFPSTSITTTTTTSLRRLLQLQLTLIGPPAGGKAAHHRKGVQLLRQILQNPRRRVHRPETAAQRAHVQPTEKEEAHRGDVLRHEEVLHQRGPRGGQAQAKDEQQVEAIAADNGGEGAHGNGPRGRLQIRPHIDAGHHANGGGEEDADHGEQVRPKVQGAGRRRRVQVSSEVLQRSVLVAHKEAGAKVEHRSHQCHKEKGLQAKEHLHAEDIAEKEEEDGPGGHYLVGVGGQLEAGHPVAVAVAVRSDRGDLDHQHLGQGGRQRGEEALKGRGRWGGGGFLA